MDTGIVVERSIQGISVVGADGTGFVAGFLMILSAHRAVWGCGVDLLGVVGVMTRC